MKLGIKLGKYIIKTHLKELLPLPSFQKGAEGTQGIDSLFHSSNEKDLMYVEEA